jgi:predicted PurR-regulated permease PerM
MKSSDPGSIEDKAFLLLLAAVSAAFAWILWPFYAAVFWAVVLAVLFSPLHRRLCLWMRQRGTLAALATVAIILVIVILPASVLTAMLVQEGLDLAGKMRSGELNFARYLQQILDALPGWMTGLLDRLGLADLAAMKERLSKGLATGIQFLAGHAVSIGQFTFDFIVGFFIMLYLLFFLLRDGAALTTRIGNAVPLKEELRRSLFGKFANVTRSTVKGNIIVALVQGALGGLMFAFLGIRAPLLWGVVMAFLSLLPAVGTALVWLPVALYFVATGSMWQGAVLIAYGVLVIGLVDNVLRPLLVGKDTKMPDYVVLISTLGGMAIFGLNGFVIGPLIAAMFIAAWDTVAASKKAAASKGDG